MKVIISDASKRMWRMIASGTVLYILPMLVREFAVWTALIKETIMIRLLT